MKFICKTFLSLQQQYHQLMAQKKEKNKIINRLTHKYRLIIYNDNNFQELGFIRLSLLNILATIGLISVVMITLVYLVIAYTPVREFIPGYPDAETHRNIIMNAIRLDSLETEIAIRDQYFNNINRIVRGEEPATFLADSNVSVNRYKDIKFETSEEDSLLRAQVEENEEFNVTTAVAEETSPVRDITLHFFTPLKGFVTNSFNPLEDHYGVDVVSPPDEVVKATLSGTVIFAEWTLETGYVIHIQHKNNYISVYKHNAELLKKAGSFVYAGEAISVVGNSGELSTGAHLHFELWRGGVPVDPEEYIVF